MASAESPFATDTQSRPAPFRAKTQCCTAGLIELTTTAFSAGPPAMAAVTSLRSRFIFVDGAWRAVRMCASRLGGMFGYAWRSARRTGVAGGASSSSAALGACGVHSGGRAASSGGGGASAMGSSPSSSSTSGAGGGARGGSVTSTQSLTTYSRRHKTHGAARRPSLASATARSRGTPRRAAWSTPFESTCCWAQPRHTAWTHGV
mmetsp:Transcript_4675/g.11648  ORF Transcript_4675/g.11648 Transcript_4675/m.11648 type:complete len:205 (-) Transcript_4675:452-1066(-)